MTIKQLILLPFLVTFGLAHAQTANKPDTGYTISVSMPYVGQGESFRFGLSGTDLTVTITASNTPVAFRGTYQTGTAYTVEQLDGPRTVQILSGNRVGQITDIDILVVADGGGAPVKMITIHGELRAPNGTTVVIRNNGDPVTVTVPSVPNAEWNTVIFEFPTMVPDTSLCNITVDSVPGMTALVYNGNRPAGTALPASWNKIIVTCEYNFAHISCDLQLNQFSTFYETTEPSIAGSLAEEGRFVAFVSNAVGLAGCSGKYRQIFLRDRKSGKTVLISKSPEGTEGNGDSFAPTMNVNGKLIAFESHATNLVAGDQNGRRDIFLWNRNTNELTRVSVNPDGSETNGDSYEPSLSIVGEEIAFTSTASTLTPGVMDNYTPNVYLYNFYENTFTLLSLNLTTGRAVGGSRPFHGNDKRRVVFCSNASTLVADDENGLWDIFLYEPGKPMKRISVPQDGTERNQGTESSSRVVSASLSGNGRWASFATTSTNLVPWDNNNKQDAFEVDLETGYIMPLSISETGERANGDSPIGQGERIALSYDGSLSVFTTAASNLGVPENNIIMRNKNTLKTTAITNIKGGLVGQPVISMGGNYVVFGTGEKLDPKFSSSGLFAAFTGVSATRFQTHYISLD